MAWCQVQEDFSYEERRQETAMLGLDNSLISVVLSLVALRLRFLSDGVRGCFSGVLTDGTLTKEARNIRINVQNNNDYKTLTDGVLVKSCAAFALPFGRCAWLFARGVNYLYLRKMQGVKSTYSNINYKPIHVLQSTSLSWAD